MSTSVNGLPHLKPVWARSENSNPRSLYCLPLPDQRRPHLSPFSLSSAAAPLSSFSLSLSSGGGSSLPSSSPPPPPLSLPSTSRHKAAAATPPNCRARARSSEQGLDPAFPGGRGLDPRAGGACGRAARARAAGVCRMRGARWWRQNFISAVLSSVITLMVGNVIAS
jgi:hypothetical protein